MTQHHQVDLNHLIILYVHRLMTENLNLTEKVKNFLTEKNHVGYCSGHSIDNIKLSHPEPEREKKTRSHLKWIKRLKPATLLKLTLFHRFFSRFLNCTNGTKSRKVSHLS